jgi:hypothetical protein
MPSLSALAYSERYAREQGKHHKTLSEWAWQLLLLIRRWWPEREIVAVADTTYPGLFTKVVERREPTPVYGLVVRRLTKEGGSPMSDCATHKMRFETPTPLPLDAAFD